MKSIEIEYNRELKPLEAILSDVTHPGEFFVAGAMEIPMPRMEVKGVGALSFPIPRPQIRALVQHATRAPYGRGEETIIDTSVRNVWQIDSASVKIGGKSWAASFGSIVSKVTAGLGCSDETVSAELYKMLVYDCGGFFLPHRDTEKTAGMFGTLVLTLPSFHHGGALRILHAEREVTIESDANEPSEISFAAFYCDCEHEVMPVREGVRVCLVYNLIQDRTKSRQRILKTPNYESQVVGTALFLNDFRSSPQTPLKIVWLLDHQYSPAGLSFSSLKGADAARARVLLQAADRAQCVVHLGVVHIGETGAAEWDGGYGFYDDDEEQHDEGEGEDDDFTAVTVDDSWQYLDEWRDRDDRPAAFGHIPIAKSELIPAGALDKEPPDEKRLTEASGNEGATYERSYHRAALVLWPANRMTDVLLKGGVAAAMPYLKQLTARGKSVRGEAIAAARRIVKAWPADAQQPDRFAMGIPAAGAADRAGMISTLVDMNAPGLVEQFIRDTVIPTYDGTENASLIDSLSVPGVANASVVLSALVKARMPDHPAECIELLRNLSGDSSPSFEQVAKAAVAGLDRIVGQNSEPDGFPQFAGANGRTSAAKRFGS